MAMKGVRKIWNSTKRMGIFTHSLTKHKKVWEAIKILDKHRDVGMFARLQERWRCFFTPWPQKLGCFGDICVTYTPISQEGYSRCWQSSG